MAARRLVIQNIPPPTVKPPLTKAKVATFCYLCQKTARVSKRNCLLMHAVFSGNIMKLFFTFALGICLATTASHADPKVLLAQADTAKIAQVKSGTLKTANASWWGFDKDDATQCLQDAINSGVSKLIVDNTGSDWIISKPIIL